MPRDSTNHCVEERRGFDVSRLSVPRIQYSLGSLQLVPTLVTVFDSRVHVFEHTWNDELFLHCLNVFSTWPDVSKEDLFSISICACCHNL